MASPTNPEARLNNLLAEELGLLRTCDEVLHESRKKLDAALDAVERHELVLRKLAEVAAEIMAMHPRSIAPFASRATNRRRTPEEQWSLQLEAMNGVYSLERRRLPNGRNMVRFNKLKWIELADQRIRLLEIISAAGPGSGPDGRGSWTSRDGLARQLGPRRKPISRDYVNHLVHLLRKDLRANGVNEYYIETHRRHGVRLIWYPGNGENHA